VAEAAWDSGVPGVGDELRWSTEVVGDAWSTGNHRGSGERRKFGRKKTPGEADLTVRPRWRQWRFPNWRSGAVSGAQDGPHELAAWVGRVMVLELGQRA
jgi:hypothetical protein